MSARPKIAYVGMTHLGVCSAIGAASKGFETLGFDVDATLVEVLCSGRLPVIEPDLDRLLADNRQRIEFTADSRRLAECDVIYVAPDVSTDDAGQSDLDTLERLLDLAIASVRQDAVLVVLSQVPPAFTRTYQQSGRPIYYQVETLVFGRAVERVTRPERFIVGCPGGPSEPLPASLRTYLEAFGCPILPMRLESAELAKIAINCCLIASISVANTLAELCERIGADWSEIVPALKLDARIGPHAYLSAGLGVAGGNLERDLATVVGLSTQLGTDAGVIRAFAANSRHRKDWALRILHAELLAERPDARLGILGLAYKENTHSVKNSASLALIGQLRPWAIRVYDPVVPASIAPHPAVAAAPSALAAADGADGLAIMTPWPQFREIAPRDLAVRMRGRLVLDPFRVLDAKAALDAGLDYRMLGVAPVRNSITC